METNEGVMEERCCHVLKYGYGLNINLSCIIKYQNSAFCVSFQSEKLSEDLIAILDAESARGQVKEPLASHSSISYLEKHKRRGKTHALADTQ